MPCAPLLTLPELCGANSQVIWGRDAQGPGQTPCVRAPDHRDSRLQFGACSLSTLLLVVCLLVFRPDSSFPGVILALTPEGSG